MKKLLLATLAVAALSLASLSASAAGTISPAFTVQVVMTPTCLINAGSSLTGNTIDFGTYTAFDAAPTVTAPTFTFTVKCTRDLGAAAPTAAVTGGNDGVVAGLNYSLTVALTAPTTGTAATPNPTPNGTPATFPFKVTGSMAGNQAGSATALQTDSRVLVVSF